MLRFPRYVPVLVARAQASQNNPKTSTSGQVWHYSFPYFLEKKVSF